MATSQSGNKATGPRESGSGSGAREAAPPVGTRPPGDSGLGSHAEPGGQDDPIDIGTPSDEASPTRAPAKNAPAKRTAAKETAKRAPAKRTAAKRTTRAGQAPASEQTPAAEETPPAKRAPAKRAPAKRTPAGQTPPDEQTPPAKRAPAKRAPAKRAPAKRAPQAEPTAAAEAQPTPEPEPKPVGVLPEPSADSPQPQPQPTEPPEPAELTPPTDPTEAEPEPWPPADTEAAGAVAAAPPAVTVPTVHAGPQGPTTMPEERRTRAEAPHGSVLVRDRPVVRDTRAEIERRQTRTFLSIFAAVILTGLLAYTFWLGIWSLPFATASGPQCYAGTPPPVSAPVSETSVRVLNSTSRRGLALTVARELQHRGFVVPVFDNDPSAKAVQVAAEVRHGPAGLLQARTVAAQVNGKTVLVMDNRDDLTIDLVLGQSFQRLRTPAEAGELLSTPTTAPRVCPSAGSPAPEGSGDASGEAGSGVPATIPASTPAP